MKKTVAGLLMAVIMVFSLAGCGHIFTTAMTIDGEEIPAGMYLLMQYLTYNEASGLVEDANTDVFEQEIEGEKAEDWIHTQTEEKLRRYIAVKRLADEKGITLSEENKTELESIMTYFDSMADYYAKLGVSADTFREYLVVDYLRLQLFDELYGEEGEMAPTREEVAEYYGKENAHMRLIYIPLQDPYTGGELENMQEVRDAFDAMAESVMSGEKTIQQAAIDEYANIIDLTYAAYAADEDEELDEAETGAEETLPDEETGEEETADGEETEEEAEPDGITNYTLNYENDESGVFTAEFIEKIKGEPVGTIDVYVTDTALILYEVIPTFEKDSDYENVRETVVTEMKEEEYEEYLDEVGATYSLEKVPGAEWFLNPKKQVKRLDS